MELAKQKERLESIIRYSVLGVVFTYFEELGLAATLGAYDMQLSMIALSSVAYAVSSYRLTHQKIKALETAKALDIENDPKLTKALDDKIKTLKANQRQSLFRETGALALGLGVTFLIWSSLPLLAPLLGIGSIFATSVVIGSMVALVSSSIAVMMQKRKNRTILATIEKLTSDLDKPSADQVSIRASIRAHLHQKKSLIRVFATSFVTNLMAYLTSVFIPVSSFITTGNKIANFILLPFIKPVVASAVSKGVSQVSKRVVHGAEKAIDIIQQLDRNEGLALYESLAAFKRTLHEMSPRSSFVFFQQFIEDMPLGSMEKKALQLDMKIAFSRGLSPEGMFEVLIRDNIITHHLEKVFNDDIDDMKTTIQHDPKCQSIPGRVDRLISNRALLNKSSSKLDQDLSRLSHAHDEEDVISSLDQHKFIRPQALTNNDFAVESQINELLDHKMTV